MKVKECILIICILIWIITLFQFVIFPEGSRKIVISHDEAECCFSCIHGQCCAPCLSQKAKQLQWAEQKNELSSIKENRESKLKIKQQNEKDMKKIEDERKKAVEEEIKQRIKEDKEYREKAMYGSSEVLQTIEWQSLRKVEDVFLEPDLKKHMILLKKEDSYNRKAPIALDKSLNVNAIINVDGNHKHEVVDWNNPILPYPYPQQQNIVLLKNGFISPGTSGTPFDLERQFILKIKNENFERIVFDPIPYSLAKCELVKFEELISIVQIYEAFGHILSEHLPRLSIVYKLIEEHPGAKLLVPNYGYVKELFDMIQFPKDKLVFYKYNERQDNCKVYYAEKLYIPNAVPSGNPSKYVMKGFRDIWAGEDLPKEERNLIVYASRDGEDERRVSNGEELLMALYDNFPGRVKVVTRKTTLPELRTIMKKSQVILGPHGSNLGGMVFASSETTIVELMHWGPWLHWWAVATALEQEHYMVYCPQGDHESIQYPVPVEEIIKTISHIVK